MRARLLFDLCPGIRLEADVDSPVAAVGLVAAYAEVFGIRECGECQSGAVRVFHRTAKGYSYYGVLCDACGAQFDFGQHREGETLFRKADKGWYHWTASNAGSGNSAATAQANDAFRDASYGQARSA